MTTQQQQATKSLHPNVNKHNLFNQSLQPVYTTTASVDTLVSKKQYAETSNKGHCSLTTYHIQYTQCYFTSESTRRSFQPCPPSDFGLKSLTIPTTVKSAEIKARSVIH